MLRSPPHLSARVVSVLTTSPPLPLCMLVAVRWFVPAVFACRLVVLNISASSS